MLRAVQPMLPLPTATHHEDCRARHLHFGRGYFNSLATWPISSRLKSKDLEPFLQRQKNIFPIIRLHAADFSEAEDDLSHRQHSARQRPTT